MKYICKVYTIEFFERLTQEVKNSIKEYKGVERKIKKIELIEYLQSIHKDQNSIQSLRAKQYLQQLNLFVPEYIEQIFESQEVRGSEKILFQGKVVSIDNIDRIFTFKRIN